MGNGEWGMGMADFRFVPLRRTTPITGLPAFTILYSRFPIPGSQAFSAIFFAFSTASSMVPTM
jgi:hypothetical protein